MSPLTQIIIGVAILLLIILILVILVIYLSLQLEQKSWLLISLYSLLPALLPGLS